jgi:ligand-binding sensor domain-containing protein
MILGIALSAQQAIPSDLGPMTKLSASIVLQVAQKDGDRGVSPDPFRPSYRYPELWTTWAIGALVRALAIDPSYVWIGTTDGVIQYHRQDESQKVYTTKDGLLSNIILTIEPDPASSTTNKGAWFGTYGGGLTHFDGESWKTYTPYGNGGTASYGPAWHLYTPAQGLGDLWVYDLVFDSKGTLWVATWKGVSRFDGKSFKTYRKEDGLIDAWVYTLTLDPKGSFWFGTEGGVTFYNGRSWKSWTHEDGLGAALSKDELPKEGYPIPVPHHQQQYKEVQTYNPNYVICSAIDSKGNLWFGTWGAGLARFDGKRWKNFTTQDGLTGNVVNSLAIDRGGVLWIGTDKGVSRYDQKGFINYNRETGLFSDPVYAIVIDEQNNKWFGTYGGLTRYTGP